MTQNIANADSAAAETAVTPQLFLKHSGSIAVPEFDIDGPLRLDQEN